MTERCDHAWVHIGLRVYKCSICKDQRILPEPIRLPDYLKKLDQSDPKEKKT